MIGQSFAPLGDPASQTRPQQSGAAGAQEPVRILNLRMPRVQGAGAPAPQALLTSPGSAALPQSVGANPTIEAILRAVLGHFAPQQMAAPSAPSGFMGQGPPSQGSGPSNIPYTPAIHYQKPLPGGTAGPDIQSGPATPQQRRTEGKWGLPERPEPLF